MLDQAIFGKICYSTFFNKKKNCLCNEKECQNFTGPMFENKKIFFFFVASGNEVLTK